MHEIVLQIFHWLLGFLVVATLYLGVMFFGLARFRRRRREAEHFPSNSVATDEPPRLASHS